MTFTGTHALQSTYGHTSARLCPRTVGGFTMPGATMPVDRDKFEQYAKPVGEFTDWEWSLFSTLEDMCGPDDEDKTITAYMADVLDLIEQREPAKIPA